MRIVVDRAGCDAQACTHHKIAYIEITFDDGSQLNIFPNGTMDVFGLNKSAIGYKATMDEWVEGLLALEGAKHGGSEAGELPKASGDLQDPPLQGEP